METKILDFAFKHPKAHKWIFGIGGAALFATGLSIMFIGLETSTYATSANIISNHMTELAEKNLNEEECKILLDLFKKMKFVKKG